MQRQIQVTADGSHTISIPEMGITYHSTHGAIQESTHVFIDAGLIPLMSEENTVPINLFEIGFGTGLNALLSWQTAKKYNKPVSFTSIELYPVSTEEAGTLNYGKILSMEKEFVALHTCPWEQENQLDRLFSLQKIKTSLTGLAIQGSFNCIYFDAFSPAAQPELWTQPVFEKLFALLQPGGMLLTYCSKSIVRHAMTAAGFTVQKIPGPWGKREMVRAEKNSPIRNSPIH